MPHLHYLHCNAPDLHYLHCNAPDLHYLHCNAPDLHYLHCNAPDLHYLHCNAHFLLELSTEADKVIKSQVKLIEDELGYKLGRVQLDKSKASPFICGEPRV